jgi:formylglycine-generating enzyme required for sulfatase activity
MTGRSGRGLAAVASRRLLDGCGHGRRDGLDRGSWTRWWRWVVGASWRHPDGPGSTLHGKDLHPVVHIGLEDVLAYADWAGKRLPRSRMGARGPRRPQRRHLRVG